MILATKLPSSVKDWIKEYIKIKRINHELTYLFTLNKIAYVVDSKKWFFNKAHYLTKEELHLLLPNHCKVNNMTYYGFEINMNKYIGFYGFEANPDEELPGDFCIMLFLSRLLYYHEDIYLTNGYLKPIRKRHIYV